METNEFLHTEEPYDLHCLLNCDTVMELGFIRAGHIARMDEV